MKTLRGIAVFVAGTLIGFVVVARVMGALLVFDNAAAWLKPEYCLLVGEKSGEIKNGVCVVHADLSHSLFSGNPILRLADGRIIEVPTTDSNGFSYGEGRFSIGW